MRRMLLALAALPFVIACSSGVNPEVLSGEKYKNISYYASAPGGARKIERVQVVRSGDAASSIAGVTALFDAALEKGGQIVADIQVDTVTKFEDYKAIYRACRTVMVTEQYQDCQTQYRSEPRQSCTGYGANQRCYTTYQSVPHQICTPKTRTVPKQQCTDYPKMEKRNVLYVTVSGDVYAK